MFRGTAALEWNIIMVLGGFKKKALHAKKEGMFMNLFTLRSECVCVREFALNGICFKSRHHFVHLEPSYPYIRSKHFNLP